MRDACPAPVLTVHRFLGRVARRVRVLAAADGVLTLATVALAVLLAGTAVRPATGLFRYAPLVFAAAGLSVLAAAALLVLRALLRRVHLRRAALLVEQRHPELKSDLTSALELASLGEAELSRYGTSRPLVQAVERLAAEGVGRLDPSAIVEAAPLRRRLWLPGLLAGLVSLVALVAPGGLADSARALVDPFAFVPPDTLVLEVAPGDTTVLRGAPVTIRVRAIGRTPERVEVALLPDAPPGDQAKRSPGSAGDSGAPVEPQAPRGGESGGAGAMGASAPERRPPLRAGTRDRAPAGGVLLAARPAADGLFSVGPFPAERSVRYRAQAGSVASPVYRLAVEEPPEVGRIAATYHYPAYLALPDRTVDGGTIEAYRGTEVRLALAANKPVARGRLLFDDGTAQPLEVDKAGSAPSPHPPTPSPSGGYPAGTRRAPGGPCEERARSDCGAREPRSGPPRIEAGTALAGTFVVTGEGGYRAVLTDRAGFETPEPIRYEIRVVPDAAPTAEIARPGENLTVDRGDVVRVEWRAADDIALGGVDLVFDAGQGEQRVALARPRAGERSVGLTGRHDWRLAALRLPAGARVAYYVEARDTDVISGPKRGASQTYSLEVRSREKDHEQLRADQREIAGVLLEALGDQLERQAAAGAHDQAAAEARGRTLEQRLAEAQARLDQALARAAEDPLAEATQLFDLNLLRSHLEAAREAAAAAGTDPSRQPPVTQALEQLASFADEIGRRGEMQDLVRRGQELMRAQTGLLDTLEQQAGKGLDPKTRAELAQALEAIEDTLRQLADQLANLPQSLPDEFMNSEAMERLAMDDLANQLEQLREAIRQGDAAKAQELARRLAAQLNQMMAALEGAQGESREAEGGGQMQRQLARQQSRLAELAREQRELVAKTEELDKRAAERQAHAQQREWGAFERQARERLDALGQRVREALRQSGRQGPPDAASFFENRALQDALREARERLDARQAQGLSQSLRQARDLLRRSPDMPGAAEQAAELDRLAGELGQLGGDLGSQLSHQERAAMQQLAERQRKLGEATDQLRREMDDLSATMPMLGPQLGRSLREAVPFMGEAAGQLASRDPRGALPPEREALQRLGQAQQAMQQAQRQMAQRGQMQGMSAPQMVARRPGGTMPGGGEGPPMPRVDPHEGGRAGAANRDFKLPGREDYQVPRVYREQVIEALKEPVPDAYRRKVERYFKNLTE